MLFSTCLQEQLRLHPSMQPLDVLKLCYQAARGAEHLLTDTGRARAWFDREYAATQADPTQPLFETISEHVARINLAAWKATGLPTDWIFRMFVHTASVPQEGRDLLADYVAQAEDLLGHSLSGWDDALAAWREAGCPAVHHSEAYRTAEHPAYRIVNRRFQCILPILMRLDSTTRVIAIDGRAASGKTTKAALLSAVLDAPVIHMDDFFLPPELRTDARLSCPGGNVHHERFAVEVLPHLASGEAFTYRVFDCGRMAFHGLREIPAAPIRIVEGSYAHHPTLGEYANLTVFADISPAMQMDRILRRNGEHMAEMFRTRWIPMEEQYIERFGVREGAALVLQPEGGRS